MTSQDTDLLAALIQKKFEHLTHLRDMGLKQIVLIRDGSITDLLDLLAVKQREIVALHGLEKHLAPFRNQAPESRPWRSPEQRRECAQRVDACQMLLAQILTVEKQCEQELKERRDDVAVQLDAARSSSQARGAYFSPPVPPSGYLNLTSEG